MKSYGMSQTKDIKPIRHVKYKVVQKIQCIYESGFVTLRFQEQYILFNPSRVVLTLSRKGSPCRNIQPCCTKTLFAYSNLKEFT